MFETYAARVQKHALQAGMRQILVQPKISVFVVARNRITKMREMYADLVGAAGLELGAQQAELTPRLLQFEYGMRLLSFRIDRNAALSGCKYILMQIQAHALLRVSPFAFDQSQVILLIRPARSSACSA